MVLRAGGRLRGDRGVDFALAHLHAALRVALAQALDGDFVAQRVAELGERHAVGLEPLTQAVRRRAVLLGDRVDGVVEICIADADAALGSARHLQLHQHEAFEHLPFQYRTRRQLARLTGVLADDVLHRAIEFALQHDIFIDHGGDAIQRLQVLRQYRGDGR